MGPQWKAQERKERSLRLSSNSEEEARPTRVLVRWSFRARPPKQVVSKGSQEQKELKDELKSKPRGLQCQNQKSQTLRPRPGDAETERGRAKCLGGQQRGRWTWPELCSELSQLWVSGGEKAP